MMSRRYTDQISGKSLKNPCRTCLAHGRGFARLIRAAQSLKKGGPGPASNPRRLYQKVGGHFQWAIQQNLPINIHSRNATPECIAILTEMKHSLLRGIFHCFSGTAEEAKQITDLGFYLGIGGVLTFKNSGLDRAIDDISLEHLVLETDAPYLAPVPYRGKRNESGYLLEVAQKLAELKNTTVEKVAMITTENSKRVFGI
jgi:TatD DNase family protein